MRYGAMPLLEAEGNSASEALAFPAHMQLKTHCSLTGIKLSVMAKSPMEKQVVKCGWVVSQANSVF